MCGVTLLRERYIHKFGHQYPLSDDTIFDMLEQLPGAPLVSDLSDDHIDVLLRVMQAMQDLAISEGEPLRREWIN